MQVGNVKAFTLVELLIVVVILGVLAAVVIPQFSDASEDANNARLMADLRHVRMAIARYTMEHDGRLPCIKANGGSDNNANNFIDRLIGKTDKKGDIIASGAFGPYLSRFPANPFASPAAQADRIKLGTATSPSGAQGWYFNTTTLRFFANTAGFENL
jgi:general secretion pathway protein G